MPADPETLFKGELVTAKRCAWSEVMSLDESLEIVRTMDALRAEWGFKYPFE